MSDVSSGNRTWRLEKIDCPKKSVSIKIKFKKKRVAKPTDVLTRSVREIYDHAPPKTIALYTRRTHTYAPHTDTYAIHAMYTSMRTAYILLKTGAKGSAAQPPTPLCVTHTYAHARAHTRARRIAVDAVIILSSQKRCNCVKWEFVTSR